uniref:Uncharacterized protein n=1 Tax=Tetranychus urticae TaxID=32264 RepID=T1KLN9_TETUR
MILGPSGILNLLIKIQFVGLQAVTAELLEKYLTNVGDYTVVIESDVNLVMEDVFAIDVAQLKPVSCRNYPCTIRALGEIREICVADWEKEGLSTSAPRVNRTTCDGGGTRYQCCAGMNS